MQTVNAQPHCLPNSTGVESTRMDAPLKALIVEDQRITARDLSEILEDLGHEVVAICTDADDAIWQMKLHDPDILFADIVIEGTIDGISMARKIREEFDVAIVFLSSHADTHTIDRASAVKPNGYLVKPFSTEAIAAAVATAMANFVKEHSNIDLQLLHDTQAKGLGLQAMEHIDAYLERHFFQEISIEMLAEVAEVSASTFPRKFKAQVGKSPYQYVVDWRIKEAKRLLRHTEMPISDISLSVGYASQAHFTTAFRKLCGVTPGSYRNL